MGVTEVKSLAEFREIINSDKYTIFDFKAVWCGPCKIISPYFEELAEQYKDVEFYKVDVDDASDIAQECGIRAMPTFKLFKNGEVVGDSTGALKPQLEALVLKTKA